MITLLELIACALALCYIYLLSLRVDLGLISLLVADLITTAVGDKSQIFGGMHLGPFDVVSICLLCAGIIRTGKAMKRINATRTIAVGYLALFAISLGRGLYENGLLVAANESRGFIGPLVAMLYFLTSPADEKSIRRYTLTYLYFGAALCVVAVLSAAGLPLGINALSSSEITGLDGRYLPASAAAAIVVCGFFSLALFSHRGKGVLGQLVPVIFFSMAIYLRHRTVWMMLLAGTAALLPLDIRLFRRLLPVALVATAAVAVLAIYGSNAQGLVSQDQFAESATNAQTLEWRLNGWKELLLDEEQNAMTVTIGKSMGSSNWRVDPVSYQAVTVAPHSEYVQEYLRVGVVGAVLILLFGLRPFLKLWRLTKTNPTPVYPSTSAWAVIVLAVLVYGVTYGTGPHAYALVGIANAIALRPRTPEEEHMLDTKEWGMTTVPTMAE